MRRFGYWLSIWFGAGLLKPAPGTWGSVFSIPFWLVTLYFIESKLLLSAFIIGLFFVGVWASNIGAKRLQNDDPKEVVIDEVVGMGITYLFFPNMLPPYNHMWVDQVVLNTLIGFALFRLFDIWKPPPVGTADERLHGGMGIMVDDVFAGIYAGIILTALNMSGVMSTVLLMIAPFTHGR